MVIDRVPVPVRSISASEFGAWEELKAEKRSLRKKEEGNELNSISGFERIEKAINFGRGGGNSMGENKMICSPCVYIWACEVMGLESV